MSTEIVKNKTGGVRERNYDVLRWIACVAVIMWHCANKCFVLDYDNILRSVCTGMTHFAVPCFFMLSGAFVLASEKNANYRDFYTRSFKKIGIPCILFMLVGFVFTLGEDLLKGQGALSAIKGLIEGQPYSHLWYMSVLVVLYLLVPVLINMRKQIGEKAFLVVTCVIFICSFLWDIKMTTGSEGFLCRWDLSLGVKYLGYFMLGYEIRRLTKKKNIGLSILFLVLGFGFCVLLTIIWHTGFTLETSSHLVNQLFYYVCINYAPLGSGIKVASALIFIGFALLPIPPKQSKPARADYTFYIYLIHPFVLRVLSVLSVFSDEATTLSLILLIIIVFAIAFLLSKLYITIWGAIDKKWNVEIRLCRLIRLEKKTA